MGKITKKIIKTIPSLEVDLEKNYKNIRHLNKLAKKGFFAKKSNNSFDYNFRINDYDIPTRIYNPNSKPDQLIIYIHGGGWVLGCIDSYDDTCQKICDATNSIVISIDYRLAPEYKFPTAFNDCYEVSNIIFKSCRKFGIPRRKVYLMGDSAGACIASCISLKRRDEKKYIPKKQVLLYPLSSSRRDKDKYPSVAEQAKNLFLSLKRMEDHTKLYKNSDEDLDSKYFAPLNAANFKKQPKTLIFVAELDILRDEGIELAEKLDEAKNDVTLYRIEEEGHGYFTAFKNTKATRKTIRIISDFL